jgi:undecaprenyl-diphosphatase
VDIFEAIIIAIVEGLTEYLPVSSTAHMIFTSSFMGIQDDDFVKMFQVSIQFGAILAVVAVYWRKFFDFRNLNFYLKLGVAVLPALILGYLFDDKIEEVLEKPFPIAVAMVAGGIVLLFIDKLFLAPSIHQEKDITISKGFIIGFWQCLAMMPGVSRSAASIIGGMQQKLDRKLAAEFSFFLAVPTMLAVTVYSVFLKDWTFSGVEQKGFEMLMSDKDALVLFLIGNVVAFLVALAAIKSFVGILNRFGFKFFGWYRIVLGTLIMFLL